MRQVRVSNGLLAPRLTVRETGQSFFIGVLAPSHYAKGNLVLQPLGGASELTAYGVVTLLEEFGASKFHKNKEGGIDARFVINEDRLEDALSLLERRDPKICEIEPGRELVDELAGFELPENASFHGIDPILTESEVRQIGIGFVRSVRQKFADEPGTSTLASAEIPSRRLFHLFEMEAPQAIVNKLRGWEAVRFLTGEEVATTEGGAHKGRSNGGITIADNFLW